MSEVNRQPGAVHIKAEQVDLNNSAKIEGALTIDGNVNISGTIIVEGPLVITGSLAIAKGARVEMNGPIVHTQSKD